MDKLINIQQLGGFPLKSDDFRFLFGLDASFDAGTYQALNAICAAFGDNYIVTGCAITGTTVSEGWVFLSGELLKVDEHETTDATWQKVITTDNERTFKGGVAYDVRQLNRATKTAAAGVVLSELVITEIDYRNAAETESITKMRTKVIEIGAWNMDETGEVEINHGLSESQRANSVIDVVTIIDDTGGRFTLDTKTLAGVFTSGASIGTANVILRREAGSIFDDTLFDDPTANRGFIKISYWE